MSCCAFAGADRFVHVADGEHMIQEGRGILFQTASTVPSSSVAGAASRMAYPACKSCWSSPKPVQATFALSASSGRSTTRVCSPFVLGLVAEQPPDAQWTQIAYGLYSPSYPHC